MKRCKNCGAFQGGSPECLVIEATGPVIGKHTWQALNESNGAPGPEYWAKQFGQTPAPSRSLNETKPPDNYMTETQPYLGQSTGRAKTLPPRNLSQAISSQQLLAQVRGPSGNPLNAQAPNYSGTPMNAQVGPTPKPFMSWHAKIIAECAPICRKLKEGDPRGTKTFLPADVRSRGPRR
jgi:hypothetical protein